MASLYITQNKVGKNHLARWFLVWGILGDKLRFIRRLTELTFCISINTKMLILFFFIKSIVKPETTCGKNVPVHTKL